MSDENAKPINKQIFDRTLSANTLITLCFTIIVAIIAGSVYIVSAYNDINKQMYELRMTDVKYNGDIDGIKKDLSSIRQIIVDNGTRQDRTDDAIRKNMETILEDLKKNREDIYRLFGNKRNGGSFIVPEESNRGNLSPIEDSNPQHYWIKKPSISGFDTKQLNRIELDLIRRLENSEEKVRSIKKEVDPQNLK